jgi:hypothetical protein
MSTKSSVNVLPDSVQKFEESCLLQSKLQALYCEQEQQLLGQPLIQRLQLEKELSMLREIFWKQQSMRLDRLFIEPPESLPPRYESLPQDLLNKNPNNKLHDNRVVMSEVHLTVQDMKVSVFLPTHLMMQSDVVATPTDLSEKVESPTDTIDS